MSPAVEAMRCALHPDAVAVATCVRCGSFLCGDCVELLGDETFCPGCYHRPDVTGRPSTRAVLALIASALGLICGAPASVVGLVLAWTERRAIGRGAAPRSSRTYVKVARVLGWIGVGVTVAGVALTWFWEWSRTRP